MALFWQGVRPGAAGSAGRPAFDAFSERVIALARLAFAALAYLVISLGIDGAGTMQAATIGYAVAALLPLLAPGRLLANRFFLWVCTVVDLVAVAAMLWTADGANGLYFITLTYALLVATLRWNWRGTVAVAGVLALILAADLAAPTLMAGGAFGVTPQPGANAGPGSGLPTAPGAPLTTASLVDTDSGGTIFTDDTLIRFGAILIAALMLGYLGATRERAQLSSARLQTDLRDTLERAQASERNVVRARRQIARDVHDGILQDLTAANFMLSSVAVAAPEGMRGDIAEVRKLLTGQQRRLRTLVDTIDTKPGSSGLSEELRELQDTLASIWKCTVRIDVNPPDFPLPPRLRADVIYFMGEATANAVRHGGATTLAMSLRLADGKVIVACEDNGQAARQPGADGGASTFMPRSLNERVVDAGGRLATIRSPFGASVRAEFPLH